jgi:hypothetical protein
MLYLSFLAYSGFDSTFRRGRSAKLVYKEIRNLLAYYAPLRRWQLVWGPTSFWFGRYADNLVYVVRDRETEGSRRSRYVIVIRGTNPISLSNWVLEDFLVVPQVPWPYKKWDGVLDPRLSLSTWLGLQVVQRLRPKSGVPGESRSLKKFFIDVLRDQSQGGVDLCVTGHSLGGTLSAALSLWLRDTQGRRQVKKQEIWDPERRVRLSTVPIAGPTPGNEDFARWFDERLGDRCDRVWNDKDLATVVWDADKLKNLPSFYGPDTPLPRLVEWLLPLLCWAMRSRKYSQICADTPPLPRPHQELCPMVSFVGRATWEHVVPYFTALAEEHSTEPDQVSPLFLGQRAPGLF